MISRNEIVAIINTAYDAVNQSKAGPITSENEAGEKVNHNLGYNTFLYAVSKLLPTVMQAEMSGEFTEHKADGTVVRHTSDDVMGAN